jgi:subfamily B ATP-binding cassette protein MsbA
MTRIAYLKVLLAGRLWWLVCILFLGLVGAVMEGLSIGLMVPILQGLSTPSDSLSNLVPWPFSTLVRFLLSIGVPVAPVHLLALAFLATIVKSAGSFVRHRFVLELREATHARLETDFLSRALNVASLARLSKFAPGSMMHKLTGEAYHASLIPGDIAEFGSTCLIILVYFFLAVCVSLKLTIAAVLLLALMSLGGLQYQLRIFRKRTEEALAQREKLWVRMADMIAGIRETRIYGRARSELERLQLSIEADRRLWIRREMAEVLRLCLTEVGGAAVLLTSFYLGRSWLGISTPMLLLFVFTFLRLHPRFMELNGRRSSIAAEMVACRNFFATMQEFSDSAVASTGTHLVKELTRSIEFENVSFAYSPQTPVLKNVSLQIPANKITALVGPSGAGKSTLVDLLFHFCVPNSGRVLIDGVDLQDIELDSWRRMIALVSQDPFLFNATIHDNIAFSVGSVSREAVIESARLADADHFIREFPGGYDTMVGTRGSSLSGGQRQRLSLARCFLRSPTILILDEATSAVDTESEARIHDMLEQLSGKRTVVVIAHRLSSLKLAEWVVCVERGTVVEQGEPRALRARGGYFATFYNQTLEQRPDGAESHG